MSSNAREHFGRNEAGIGIAATGLYIPSGHMDAAEVARASGISQEVIETRFGIRRKPRASAEEHPSFMAIQAARRCLEEANQDPARVDLLLWTGSEHKDYCVWSAGIKVQHELGCDHAWAMDLAARCSTNIVALKLARDIMRSDPSINTVLLAGGHRTADLVNYQNQRSRFLFNLSDAGSAILLKRGQGAEVLETSIITDGAFSEDVIIPAGGTRNPASVQTVTGGMHYFDVPDPAGMKERLDRLSMENFVRVITQAVERSGYVVGDIAYLALLHMKRSAHDAVLSQLGLPPERSIYLDEYGHVGAPDQVISLRLALEWGLIKEGDLVVLASAGIGYTWAATAVRWETNR